MDHDFRGLPLHRYIWYVVSLLSTCSLGTLVLLSCRCLVVHLWVSVHDLGPKLHRLPSNDRFLCIRTWLCVNPALYRSLQRGIWQETSLSRLRCWVFGNAYPDCRVRWLNLTWFCADWPDQHLEPKISILSSLGGF